MKQQEYNVVFDYRSFYDDYPSGLILSEPEGKVVASYYVESDTAGEMFSQLHEYVEETGVFVDAEHSTYTLVYKQEEPFSPELRATFTSESLHCLAKMRKEGEDIKPIVEKLFVCEEALREQLALTVCYAVNLIEQEEYHE